MEYKFVKPKKGILIRDPRTKSILPEEGARVPWIGAHGRFYRRRMKDGSIEEIIETSAKELFDTEKKYGGKK